MGTAKPKRHIHKRPIRTPKPNYTTYHLAAGEHVLTPLSLGRQLMKSSDKRIGPLAEIK